MDRLKREIKETREARFGDSRLSEGWEEASRLKGELEALHFDKVWFRD